MKKIRVVWLCHFSNDEIKQKFNNNSIPNFAPWISDMLNLIPDESEIELHLISPDYFTNKNVDFSINSFHYHFYRYKPFYISSRFKDISFNYKISQKNISKIINKIKPDLIHLHGSENPVYSSGILRFIEKYPILLTIQGFVFLSKSPKNIINRYIRWNRSRIEKKINSSVKYITAATEDVKKVLERQSISANIYPLYYPTTKPLISATDYPEKKYDIVFSARITKNKGVEDLIFAIKLIKEKRPDISAIIIGGGSEDYIKHVKNMIVANDLNNNIIFAGFQSTQQDMFKIAAQAKVSVLPTYFDGLPGSIREAMFMKLPVVAYAVGGIPALNQDVECITLVEKQNINELAEKILLVLNDEMRTNRLICNAYKVITDRYGNDKIYDNLLKIYRTVINSENH